MVMVERAAGSASDRRLWCVDAARCSHAVLRDERLQSMGLFTTMGMRRLSVS
jgi:hypothetical protein